MVDWGERMMVDVILECLTAISLAVQVYAWWVIVCSVREMEQIDRAFEAKMLAIEGHYFRKMSELFILEAELQTREWIERLHNEGILTDREYVDFWRRIGE